ncbi:sushi, von Willebrand factor type A, EGF and pentraxin domain-containing protein 1-like [Dendronephthya gigantea]|uniref:sushi, von Willebrand factor type A, EGF and pentraxin domain-containing protein 1-like n=1 Tax=Dendronephthya gigantea TaxID=151771 RepID=UPI00106CEDF9|nr:sushi, von Willebrand factor type A, EGF and pentraxin domain-containing protein 1-like [Dendronephthya gigantea]XP_028408611.1 sushi, von Willebrand factor type A, EGF and pentraxin domain-containing protein 1-like [Dendronephthya gigantea]XP_028408612.1 sushi, von Willebrand factor type A, EGF and pentraxin domain-containing protein 1-like [Dendronephthya gigantea]XP_028408613.1 sushi, von Willebrand factor type A, EGF and pentraxin domain-containing protein 1-like [Dendronephthya gigantea]
MNWLICVGVLFAALCSHSEARAGCKSPGARKNGHVHGDWGDLQDGSTLRLKCNKGYKFKGKEQVFCYSGQWSATLGTCEVVTCQPPRTSCLSISDPPSCFTGPSPYDTHCKLSCPSGYRDSAELRCNHEGKWEGRDVVCEDYEAPDIECPQQGRVIVQNTDLGKAIATIRLPTPKYSDNSQRHGGKLNFSATLNGKPISAHRKLRMTQNLSYSVRYLVKDEEGNQAKCDFSYRVVDKEPPKIENCPGDIVKARPNAAARIRITWKEPRITDNSGHDALRVHCDRPNGSEFPLGRYLVTYTASDKSGNKAICKFRVILRVSCNDLGHLLSSILNGVTIANPRTPCRTPATDPQKCNKPVAPGLPDRFQWKSFCRKTCKVC